MRYLFFSLYVSLNKNAQICVSMSLKQNELCTIDHTYGTKTIQNKGPEQKDSRSPKIN